MLRAALCLATALLGVTPAAARDLTGAITIRERLALPPGTQVLLEAMPQRGSTRFAEVTPGGQPPFAFTATADDGPVVLLAGIRTPDGRIWVTDPIHLPAGVNDPGMLTAFAIDSDAFGDVLACGEAIVQLGYRDDAAHLSRGRPGGGRETRRLPQVPAASGSRFQDGATAIHTKGDGVLMTWDGQDYPACRPFPWPTSGEVTARGNEPGWVMTTSLFGTALSMETGQRMRAARQVGFLAADAVRVLSPGLPELVLTAGICADTMTGMPYPAHAALMLPEGALQGCAGDPAQLLAGRWTVSEVNGTPLPPDAEVTLDIDDGTLSGRGGCNRFSGAAMLSGEGLSLGPVAATKMACAPALMEVETAFFAALAAIDRFDLDADGSLVLLAADRPVIRATR